MRVKLYIGKEGMGDYPEITSVDIQDVDNFITKGNLLQIVREKYSNPELILKKTALVLEGAEYEAATGRKEKAKENMLFVMI